MMGLSLTFGRKNAFCSGHKADRMNREEQQAPANQAPVLRLGASFETNEDNIICGDQDDGRGPFQREIQEPHPSLLLEKTLSPKLSNLDINQSQASDSESTRSSQRITLKCGSGGDDSDDDSSLSSTVSEARRKRRKAQADAARKAQADEAQKPKSKNKRKVSPKKMNKKRKSASSPPKKKAASVRPTKDDTSAHHRNYRFGGEIAMAEVSKNLDPKLANPNFAAVPRRDKARFDPKAVRQPTAGGFVVTAPAPAAAAVPEFQEPETSHYRALHLKEKNCKKTILAMSQGHHTADGRKMGMWKEEPHKSNGIDPLQKHLADEIVRRATEMVLRNHPETKKKGWRMPRPNQWKIDRCLNWLDKFLILGKLDIEFVTEEEGRYHEVTKAAAEEKKELTDKKASARSPPWSLKAWLRLLIASVQDNAKAAFEKKDDALERPELDSRNHEDRPASFCKIVATDANDPDQVCQTDALPELHSLFAAVMTLTAEDIPQPVTEEDCQKRLNYCKAAVTLICRDWEASGKGFGGARDPDDENFGRLDEVTLHEAGDQRKNFLGKYREHILHHWHLLDQQETLRDVCANLDECIAICSGSEIGEISVSDTAKENSNKRKEIEEEQVKFSRSLSASMDGIACDSAERSLREARKELRLVKREQREHSPASAPWEDLELERAALEKSIEHQENIVNSMRRARKDTMAAREKTAGSRK